jgi:hypothetical protein
MKKITKIMLIGTLTFFNSIIIIDAYTRNLYSECTCCCYLPEKINYRSIIINKLGILDDCWEICNNERCIAETCNWHECPKGSWGQDDICQGEENYAICRTETHLIAALLCVEGGEWITYPQNSGTQY